MRDRHDTAEFDAQVREHYPNGEPTPIEWTVTRHDEPARIYPAPSRLWRGVGTALAITLAIAAFAWLVWRGWA